MLSSWCSSSRYLRLSSVLSHSPGYLQIAQVALLSLLWLLNFLVYGNTRQIFNPIHAWCLQTRPLTRACCPTPDLRCGSGAMALTIAVVLLCSSEQQSQYFEYNHCASTAFFLASLGLLRHREMGRIEQDFCEMFYR